MAILPWTLLSPSSSPTLLRLPSFSLLRRTFLFVLIFIWTHPFLFQSNTHPIHYHLSTLFYFCSRSPLPFFKKVSFQHTPRSLLSTSRTFTNPAIGKQRATRKPWIPGIWRRHLDLRFTGLSWTYILFVGFPLKYLIMVHIILFLWWWSSFCWPVFCSGLEFLLLCRVGT